MNTMLDFTQKALFIVGGGPLFSFVPDLDGERFIDLEFDKKTSGLFIAHITIAALTALTALKIGTALGGAAVITGVFVLISSPSAVFALGILAAKWGITAIIQAVALKHIAMGVGVTLLGLTLWVANITAIANPLIKGGVLLNKLVE